jgi:hypothetical protein
MQTQMQSKHKWSKIGYGSSTDMENALDNQISLENIPKVWRIGYSTWVGSLVPLSVGSAIPNYWHLYVHHKKFVALFICDLYELWVIKMIPGTGSKSAGYRRKNAFVSEKQIVRLDAFN